MRAIMAHAWGGMVSIVNDCQSVAVTDRQSPPVFGTWHANSASVSHYGFGIAVFARVCHSFPTHSRPTPTLP